jgi:hypothetical protein
MANVEQLKILEQGVDIWNNWRGEHPSVKIDLVGAMLSEADLQWVDFSRSDLRTANLSLAKLTDARLTNADLSGANLIGTDFSSSRLSGARFNDTSLNNTNFTNVDLSETLGLSEASHWGISHVSNRTLQLSKGNIPVSFLRGCGLSDLDIEAAKLAQPGLDPGQVTEITYKIHQLYLGGGIQYYSCFISYSSRDHDFAQHLYDDLQNNGVRCWFAPEDLKIGDQIRPRIDQEIRLRDKLLVILSENSVKSEWVGDEVEAALEEESKSNRLVLFPIRLDDAVMSTRDDWAAKIKRRRHIGDFSNWKDKASYQKAFERLLRDLKATK